MSSISGLSGSTLQQRTQLDDLQVYATESKEISGIIFVGRGQL